MLNFLLRNIFYSSYWIGTHNYFCFNQISYQANIIIPLYQSAIVPHLLKTVILQYSKITHQFLNFNIFHESLLYWTEFCNFKSSFNRIIGTLVSLYHIIYELYSFPRHMENLFPFLLVCDHFQDYNLQFTVKHESIQIVLAWICYHFF